MRNSSVHYSKRKKDFLQNYGVFQKFLFVGVNCYLITVQLQLSESFMDIEQCPIIQTSLSSLVLPRDFTVFSEHGKEKKKKKPTKANCVSFLLGLRALWGRINHQLLSEYPPCGSIVLCHPEPCSQPRSPVRMAGPLLQYFSGPPQAAVFMT